MKKEPFGIYLFRLLLTLGILGYVIMLYWSSSLVEQDLKVIQNNLSQLKSDINSIKSELRKSSHSPAEINSPLSQKVSASSHEDPSIPNLLTEDLFYTETLPKMLGPDFKAHGIRREATIGKPDHLHPFTNWAEISSWISYCTVAVADLHVGKYETLAPSMATKMELRKNKDGKDEYWIHLRQDVFWQPINPDHFAKGIVLAPHFLKKHQVTAHDFKFYYDAFMNPNVSEPTAVILRNSYSDVEEIRIIDDFTFVVRWKTEKVTNAEGKVEEKMKYLSKSFTAGLRPLASFLYKYFPDGTKIIADDVDPDTYRKNPIWAQNFSQHWAKNIIPSCGGWIFDGMTEREIRFKRNPDFYAPYAVLVEGLEVNFKSSFDAIWEEFKSGSLDLYQVPPNQLAEVERFLKSEPYQEQQKRGLGIRRIDYVARMYSYIGWNELKPYFNSKKVRQALYMAVDRKRIIEQYLNGMGIETTGTFFRYSPSYDESIVPYPYDVNQARQLLAEEGWYDSNGDGILDKQIGGESIPFQITMNYYVKNPTSKSIVEYVSTALKEIGIRGEIEGLDLADISSKLEDHNFDAYFLAWGLGVPPEDPRQLWYSNKKDERGSSNYIGFSNKEADQIIDELTYEYDPKKRIELYHRFDRILYDEAPYIFLYTNKRAMVYRDYLQNVFIPAERQDLIPGANVGEPISEIFWIKTGE